jgi:cellulose synthase/poly-beta-1,6-N-acetylglucosamine synthase-like glycosyltransferase
MTLLFWIALATLLLTVLCALELALGNRRVVALRDVPPADGGALPRVSVIVAARNEARNIEEALQSLLRLSYPDYELIVVNDRSEDATGEILDAAASRHNRIRALHVNQLPAGWLGKNHALWLGANRANGELLLFTDADIVMEPSVLSRAVSYLTREGLDHLAATPSMRMPNAFLGMFGASFIIYFSLFSRPWKARDPKSHRHIGIGAFNLVRSEVYRRVGGHEKIRLRPDDDLKLGKLVKDAGYRQDVVYAPEFLAVEWYASLKEVIHGLEKNAFAGADYNILLVLSGALFHLSCSVWPFAAVWLTHGAIRWFYAATVACLLALVADSARFHRSRPWYAFGYPFTSLLFVYILLRTMTLNLVRRGIYWRGTFYSLAELKKNRI